MPPGTNISSYCITTVFTISDKGPTGLGDVKLCLKYVHTSVYLAVCSLCSKHNVAQTFFQVITKTQG